MPELSQILINVPIWVWPLFVLLVVLGLRASRTRTVPKLVIYLMPLLGLLTLRSLLGFNLAVWAWGVAGVAYVAGLYLGMIFQKNHILEKGPKTVKIKGEWLTLTMMMILFLSGFVNGFLNDVAPQTVQSIGYVIGMTLLLSLTAGTFMGRSIMTWRWILPAA